MILPFPLLSAAHAPAHADVVPIVAEAPDDGGIHRAIWRVRGKSVALPRGYSVVALSQTPARALVYESGDGGFAVADSNGRLRTLPRSAEWYGLDPRGRVLSMTYETGRYLVRRGRVVVARTVSSRPGDTTVDSPRLVASPDGRLAVGYDSGRKATAKGEHAIDTAVFDARGRCLRVWRDVTPEAFLGEFVLVSPHVPHAMQPEAGVTRVMSVRTGRSAFEFGGGYAIADGNIVGLSYGKNSVVTEARIVWPPAARTSRLRIAENFEPGLFSTVVGLVRALDGVRCNLRSDATVRHRCAPDDPDAHRRRSADRQAGVRNDERGEGGRAVHPHQPERRVGEHHDAGRDAHARADAR